MNFTDIWNILGIIAIILLLVFARGKNSVWGGLTLGVIVGLIIAIVLVFKGETFLWSILKKSVIVGVLSGGVADILSRISKKVRKKCTAYNIACWKLSWTLKTSTVCIAILGSG